MASVTRENVAMAFGTPIAALLLPDSDALNRDLRRVILDREKASGGVVKSNVGGWHSTTDLFAWPEPCVGQLQARIVDSIRQLTSIVVPTLSANVTLSFDCWANVSRRGHYNSIHDHPGSVWSGVYYVSSGTPDNDTPTNGRLEFIDPRVGAAMAPILEGAVMGGRYLVEPKPGLLVLFPSWLKHMVHPFDGEGERISISFNARMEISK